MKTQSTMLHVRMDTEMKRRATEALAAMGLTASQAVRLLFHRIAVDQAFPLELKVPNAQTRNAMAEIDEMVKKRRARRASRARTRCFPSLKTPAAGKAAKLPRRVDYARQFLKDWKRLSRHAPLGPEWRGHALKGLWAHSRECHVGGDFLLICRIDDTDGPSGSVYFARVGTHAQLFE